MLLMVCLAICCVLLFSGCSDSNAQYLGKWKLLELVEYLDGGQKRVTKAPNTSGGELEFLKNKTVSVTGIAGVGGGSGKWTVLEDGRAKIVIGHRRRIVMFGSIKGDTLTITVSGQRIAGIFKNLNYSSGHLIFPILENPFQDWQ